MPVLAKTCPESSPDTRGRRGQQPRHPIKRGAYGSCRRRSRMPPAALIDEVKKANIRGRGGAGLPDGREVELHPEGRQSRSTSSSTPTRASPARTRTARSWSWIRTRSVEGCIIGCYAHRRARRVHLRARRAAPLEARGSGARSRRRQRKGYLGKNAVRRRLPESTSRPHRRRRVHLRRGDVAPQLARGQARRAAPQAAVPGVRPARSACPTTVNNLETHRRRARPRSRWAARRSQASATAPPRRRRPPLRRQRPREEARRLRGCVGLTLRELIYDLGGGVARRQAAQGGDPRRLVDAGAPRRRDGRRAERESTRSCLARQERHSTCPLGVDTFAQALGTMLGTCCAIVMAEGTDPVAALPQPDALLPPRVVRPVHAVPRGHRLALPHRDQHRAPGDGTLEELDLLHDDRQQHHGQHHLRRSARARRCRRSASCKKFRKRVRASTCRAQACARARLGRARRTTLAASTETRRWRSRRRLRAAR